MKTPSQKKSLIKHIITILMVLLMVSISILYAKYQNIFTLAPNKIIVNGNKELTTAEVIKVSGLEPGMDLMKIDIHKCMKALEIEPYIRYAFVQKRLPDKIVITIRERVPVVRMEMDDVYSVDNQGILLPPPRHSENLPEITGIQAVLNVNFGSSVIHPRIRQGVGIVCLIRKKYPDLYRITRELHWTDPEASWQLDAGSKHTIIRLGEHGLKNKIRTLDAFIRQWDITKDNMTDYHYIDLRYNRQVIVKTRR